MLLMNDYSQKHVMLHSPAFVYFLIYLPLQVGLLKISGINQIKRRLTFRINHISRLCSLFFFLFIFFSLSEKTNCRLYSEFRMPDAVQEIGNIESRVDYGNFSHQIFQNEFLGVIRHSSYLLPMTSTGFTGVQSQKRHNVAFDR